MWERERGVSEGNEQTTRRELLKQKKPSAGLSVGLTGPEGDVKYLIKSIIVVICHGRASRFTAALTSSAASSLTGLVA
jgi:hypothetical protein